jgi:hypothetical protein
MLSWTAKVLAVDPEAHANFLRLWGSFHVSSQVASPPGGFGGARRNVELSIQLAGLSPIAGVTPG